MPEFRIELCRLSISRNACCVDTNILFSAFLDTDERHDYANDVLAVIPEQRLVPFAVIVETWGMLVGKSKRFDCGMNFLAWVNDPGQAVIVPDKDGLLITCKEIARKTHVDLVDAVLVSVSDEISRMCDLKPALPIATFDTGDFYKFFTGPDRPRIRVLDAHTLDYYP